MKFDSLRTCPPSFLVFGVALFRLCFGLNVIEEEVVHQLRVAEIEEVDNVTENDAQFYFEQFGKFGSNYYVGSIKEDKDKKERTRIPYINCQQYDKYKCDRGNREHCKKTVKCGAYDPSGGSQKLACMANYYPRTPLLNVTFSENEIIEPTLMDCWQHEESQLAECKEPDKCVADIRKTGRSDWPSYFCCCRTHNCNEEMVYKEERVEPPATTSSSMTNVSLSDESDGLHFLQLTIILFAGLLSIAILAVFAFSIPKLRNKIYKRSGTAKFFLPFNRNRNDRREQLKELLGDWKRREFDTQITLADGRRVHRESISLKERVSVGRYGQVFKAFVAGPDCYAAVKIVPDKKVGSWKNEMEIYSVQTLRENRHIASFFGGFPSESDFWLVFDFYENNSLYDFLKLNTVSLAQSVNFIASMLEGLAFLHEEIATGPNQKPIIVHRDFKSKNILVTAEMNVRIADFGHAMKCTAGSLRPEKIQGQVGTIRYMSPEVLEGATGASCSAFQQIDVYAAALVIWEVLSRTETDYSKNDMEPYAMPYEKELGFRNASIGQMRNIVLEKGKRPATRESLSQNKILKEIVGTMCDMWVFEPDSRITCSCARERLLRIRDQNSIS